MSIASYSLAFQLPISELPLAASRRRRCGWKFKRAATPEWSIPSIEHDLHTMMLEKEAKISQDGVVQSFGNDGESLKAAQSGCAIAEMTHFGRLKITGDDRVRFLHNQSTADLLSLEDGQGCHTVFVTPTARTIDLATAWIMESSVVLFISPNLRHNLLRMLNKYIFFADKVKIEDITDTTYCFSLIGPESDNIMRKLKLDFLIDKPFGTHLHFAVNGGPVTVGVGCGLSIKGYTMLLSTSTAKSVWESLVDAGAIPMGSCAWECLRILQGRPSAGNELVEEYNVLEAGLWNTISQSKGCYIGQETIARLIARDGVKQHLWGIKLDAAVEPGVSLVTEDGIKAGKVTSCTETVDGYYGLAYVRKQATGGSSSSVGLKVKAGEVSGTIVEVPFICAQH